MDMNRRQFFKVCGVGLGASSLAALGVAPLEAFADQVRHFKLTSTTETRNTCPYCSVGCGLILYSQGDAAKNVAKVDPNTSQSAQVAPATDGAPQSPARD